MKQFLKKLLKSTPLYHPIRTWVFTRRQKRIYAEWVSKGKLTPPPHLAKQLALRDFAKRYGLRVLVETGTFNGDMVEAMKPYFDRIYSIELSEELYQEATRRFAGDTRIEIIQGDSGIELGNLIPRLTQPALFWLDGHHCEGTARGGKDTPIHEELTHIFSSAQRGHVIVIDDARDFGGDPAYPTIEELSNFIRAKVSNVGITVENDSIRITPPDKNER